MEEVRFAKASAATELIWAPLNAFKLEALKAFNCGAVSAAVWAVVKALMSVAVNLAIVDRGRAAIWLGVWPMTIELTTTFLLVASEALSEPLKS